MSALAFFSIFYYQIGE